MKTRISEIHLGVHGGYFPFECIELNGYTFKLSDTCSKKGQMCYRPLDRDYLLISSVFCVRGIDGGKESLDGFLPQKIIINNRAYKKRCGNYYTPQYPEPSEIRIFFNYISSSYEFLVDKKLNKKTIDIMFDIFKEPFDRRVEDSISILDYGMGTGLSYIVLKKKRGNFWKKITLHGCDISDQIIKIGQKKGFENITVCDYAKTGYKDESFNMVMASFVTHYFIDEKPFHEFYRILKPGGVCIFNIHKSSVGFKKSYTTLLTSIGFSKVSFRKRSIETESEGTKNSVLVVCFRPPTSYFLNKPFTQRNYHKKKDPNQFNLLVST